MRSEASDLVSEAARSFHEKGYVPVDVLSPTEAARYRDVVLDLRERADDDPVGAAWDLPHGVSRTPELWSLITHAGLLAAVRDVLRTCDVTYAEHSALQVRHEGAASKWHRDSVDTAPGAWAEPRADRRLARVACCLEGGDVRPGTCILFDPGLSHAVGPTWETSVAALLAFGANNAHTRRHRRHFGCPDNPYKLALSGYLSERGLA